MDKTTIVCRCEEITVADIENAITQGAETFDDVKRLTRSGMGLCQAKTCRSVITGLIAEIKHKSIDDMSVSRLRMPLSPIEMALLAKAQSNERQEK
jgi:NAD(P)H-nitrite reductase large subunit